MKMKRIIALLTALVLELALTACGETKPTDDVQQGGAAVEKKITIGCCVMDLSNEVFVQYAEGYNQFLKDTKGAVEMLTKAFAADLRPNIQVNLVGPTITYTPMMVGLLPPDETVRNNIAANEPAMRIGYESDIVGTVMYLASPASDFVTANSIYPDGGLVATS